MTEALTPIDQIDPVPEPKPRRKRNGDARALAKMQDAAPPAPVSEGDAFAVLFERLARDPTIDPGRIHQFLQMKREEDERRAKRAFNAAMAEAKAAFEPIVKRHLVNRGAGGTYKHEDLADISAAVDPVLARHGLNTRFRTTSNPNEPITCTCVVTHRDGHFEETTLAAGADNSGGKNSIQSIASTLTYLQRMTKKAALGLAAARDDDGRAAGEQPSVFITDAQCSAILDKIAETEADTEKFCSYFKIDGVAKLPAGRFNHAMNLLNQKGRKA